MAQLFACYCTTHPEIVNKAYIILFDIKTCSLFR